MSATKLGVGFSFCLPTKAQASVTWVLITFDVDPQTCSFATHLSVYF